MQTVRLYGSQVDKIVELVKEAKDKVTSGEVTGLPHSAEDEIRELDSILYALGEDDEDDEGGE